MELTQTTAATDRLDTALALAAHFIESASNYSKMLRARRVQP